MEGFDSINNKESGSGSMRFTVYTWMEWAFTIQVTTGSWELITVELITDVLVTYAMSKRLAGADTQPDEEPEVDSLIGDEGHPDSV